ncbi:hypothetical protein PC129_g18033 [Phytophthora cactorum]|uniref:Uncharacterized protein n=1 Tax=Phytophthora cactorum TaxID=29920 RepID=A0A329RLE3_9STRA|nr:hypothetical protein Pcac1_g5523 [Phytophthora cactorum]KAG2800197.1 hypothetical protein PC112_g20587 [Phytophthora cactorum]KAG2800240.1 hypothetical protein PC111_g20057 [Phytophthora cactorum]KAG2833860.1 hypothetical protein PC113_g20505 [Phytophthora cactorum]KAG2879099.1 hypothetical protein PC114_g22749 [Phytophthora cactorum]
MDKTQRGGSSSFFDRVKLAVQELATNENSPIAADETIVDATVATEEKLEEEKEEKTGSQAEEKTSADELVTEPPSDEIETEESGAALDSGIVETEQETGEQKDGESIQDGEEDTDQKKTESENQESKVDSEHLSVVAPPFQPGERKPAPTSPRASDFFGRFMSAMRQEQSPPPSTTGSPKKSSLVDAMIAAAKALDSKADTAPLPATVGVPNHPDEGPLMTEKDENRVEPSGLDELNLDTLSAKVETGNQVTSDVVAAPPTTETGQDAAQEHAGSEATAQTETGTEVSTTSAVIQKDGDSVGTNERSRDGVGTLQQVEPAIAIVSPPLQEPASPPVSPPQSSSRLFGRLIAAMRSEGPTTETAGVPIPESSSNPTASIADSSPSSNPEPSTSLFDRLISTVRNELPAAAISTQDSQLVYIPHAEIAVDECSSNDSDDDSTAEDPTQPADSTSSKDPEGAEAAAIENMVELTLDVGGEDEEEKQDAEPSIGVENDTIAENHESEPSVTNEIDHVDELYPMELQNAVKRAGTALLNVLPSQETAGISAECFRGIERMTTEGEVLSMQHVKEIETAGVLTTCANVNADESLRATEENIAELRAAVAACCTGRLSWTVIPELLALWSIIHTSVSDGISDEAGEKANILEPFDIVTAAERKGTRLNLAGFEHEENDEKVEVDNSLFDEQLAHAALAQAMAGLQGSLLVSRQRLGATLQAMREGRAALVGGCLALVNIPLLRFEIARDFFQTAGLFLSGMFKPTLAFVEHMELPEYVLMLVRGLRAAYTIIAIDISAFIQWISKFSNAGVFISIVVVMLAHIVFIFWLYKVTRYMPRGADNVRHGHESMTWASLAATNKRMAMISSFLITASLTAYLPLTQFCFSVLDINAHKEDARPNIEGTVAAHFVDKPYWGLIVFEAIALLITFSLPLPFVLVSSIRSNRPRGSLENAKVTYDLDGEEVPFDDKVYARLVASDPSQLRCPYRSLYNGFEQRWSTYKVMQLVAKAMLAVVVVASSRNVSIGGIIVCGVYVMVVLLTTLSRPFIDPVNDLMESSAKFTALVTAVGGTLGAWAQRNDMHSNYIQGFLAFVLVVHFANLWVMLTVTLLGVANTRTMIKNWLGWLSFSDTTRMIEDARAPDIMPHWDLNKEAKHRVWQAFWRAVLYDLSPHHEQHNEDLVKESPEAARLMALDQAVVSSGIRRVSSHWRGKQQRYTTRLRQVVRTALEGIDVYWNEEIGIRDGHLDSMSCFGKMYVVPYPFHCVVVYDNTNDEAIIWDEVDESAPRDNKLHSNLAKLLFLNFSPAIVAKRELRQKIRALADLKTPVRFPFSRVEKALVTDCYEWTPIEGLKPWKIQYKTMVEFTCHYTYGVFKVKTSGDSIIKDETKRPMADGFITSMAYKDGRGYAKAPRTGKRFEITGRKAVRDSDHFGLNPDMEENEHLKQIFEQTRTSWELGVKKMRAEHREYRRKLIEIHAEANAVLSDDFWYFVYNNQYLSRKDLEQYLTTRETNPLLRQLPQTHEKALDALYLRQRFIMNSPSHKLWYIFWDDVYARNSGMSRLIPSGEPKPGRACRADFDPNSASSICYKKKSREDLEQWLTERGLLIKTGMFHPGLLQLLYDELKKLDDNADPKNIMKLRPGGRSFRRRSMIASMVWRPTT